MDTLIIFVVLLMGGATSHFAKQRGRHPLGWFAIGLLFGLFGLIFLFLLPKLNKEENAQTKLEIPTKVETENHSLFSKNSEWYYLNKEHQQTGPITFEALIEMWDKMLLSKESYVWCLGMAEWKKVSELPYLEVSITEKKTI